MLYVPLKSEETVYGVLCLGEYGLSHPFSHEQRAIVEAVAGLAAISVARVEAEAQARTAELTAESERLRTALLDSLSHELRTPVTAILGAIGSLQETRPKLTREDQDLLVATIRDSAMRMNRLITNLLGMVRLESGMMRLNRRPCDIADLIGVALAQLGEALEGRPVLVAMSEDTSDLWVDDVLMEQALVNVLSNAVKYSPEGSPIEIHAERLPQAIRLSIRDYGIGIEADEVDKLFEKFYRSPKARRWPGTGLGLAICQGIVAAHGGRVWAAPGAPQGTVIYIELPCAEPAEGGAVQ
jgi:two-component system sensor histidine kinase KdpD